MRHKRIACYRTSSPEGFTLLEVMVSLAILGIALTCILQLFSGGLDSVKRSGDYTKALLYAKEKMDEVMSSNVLIEGEKSGEFADENYKWYSEIRPLEFQGEGEEIYEDLPLRIYEVTLRVSWLGDGKEKDIEINTLKSLSESFTQ